MKKLFIISVILFCAVSAYAQKRITSKQQSIIAARLTKEFYKAARKYYLNPTDSLYYARERSRIKAIDANFKLMDIQQAELVDQIKKDIKIVK